MAAEKLGIVEKLMFTSLLKKTKQTKKKKNSNQIKLMSHGDSPRGVMGKMLKREFEL